MTDHTLNSKESEAVRHIRNTLMQYGRMPSVRELMSAMEYRSPRSAAMILEKLENKGILLRKEDGKFQFNESALKGSTDETVDVPLVGTTSCGSPMFAEENIEAYYKMSTKLAPPPAKHFFLRVQGDSMNKKGINDGNLVLVRQQTTAQNGNLVVALIDDAATIKEFRKENGIVLLRPCSTNPVHKPIIMTEDFRIQGIVIKTLSNL